MRDNSVARRFRRAILPACAILIAGVSLAAHARAAENGAIPGIGPTGPAKEIAGTFKFTEGPATDKNGVVYFTDVPAAKVYKIEPDNTAVVVREESHGANGLMFNAAGDLVGCQKNGIVVWSLTKKEEHVLASEFDGKPLNRPNDLVIDNTGGVYFTDPIFALDGKSNQPVSGVFYVTADGKLTRLIDNIVGPNGIILSPDEKTLYVITFLREQQWAYPVLGPRKLGPGKVFCTVEQPAGKKGGGGDGCAVDSRGNLYIAAATGVQVFDPQGKLLGTIKVPKSPSNCEFGGTDLKTLYVTARTSVYAFPMEVTGHRFPGGPAK
ncbi:MAG TPA: SMP-30/gluconolactonase/LRE family protein [Pirellulales bacterium]|nr:SMP-30/gluconolactonase/LRE family protein [Pirellulales bacterium]